MRFLSWLFATLLAVHAAAHAGAPAAPALPELDCRGDEPSWLLLVGARSALAVEPEFGERAVPRERLFRGRVTRLDQLRPPAAVWRGVARGEADVPAVLVAVLREEVCTPTMGEGDAPRELPWQVVVSGLGARAVAGCCSLRSGLELMSAPVADTARKPVGDWSRHLPSLASALRTCLNDGLPSARRVLKAWPTNRGKAVVRLADAQDSRYDCTADLGSARVESLVEVAADGVEPTGAGAPVFWPARAVPPALHCGRIERVLDARFELFGWLQYEPC